MTCHYQWPICHVSKFLPSESVLITPYLLSQWTYCIASSFFLCYELLVLFNRQVCLSCCSLLLLVRRHEEWDTTLLIENWGSADTFGCMWEQLCTCVLGTSRTWLYRCIHWSFKVEYILYPDGLHKYWYNFVPIIVFMHINYSCNKMSPCSE